nr:VWA domain-containing protein [Thiomicrorhabdus cannonii]
MIVNFLAQSGWVIDRFAAPMWLWLLALWPLWWLVTHFGLIRLGQDDLRELQARQQTRFWHPLIHLQSGAVRLAPKPLRLGWRKGLLELLRGFIIAGLALALAQPERLQPEPPQPQQKTVRDVVFVIESSASFLLEDYRVNDQPESRMNAVKRVLDSFMGGLNGNRFGLIVYAQNAYTLMPLSSDLHAARLYLKRLKPYLAGRTDEAMGEALGLALKQTEAGMQHGDDNTLKRVVVLISDGLAQPSRVALDEAINYAQMMNVPIYTVGVGASSREADQRLYSGLLYQPLESESLRHLAAATNGRYYQIGGGDDLQNVLAAIDRSAGVPMVRPPSAPKIIALYWQPLLWSWGMLALYALLSPLLLAKTARALAKEVA